MDTTLSNIPAIFKAGFRNLYVYFAAGATSVFVYANLAGEVGAIAVVNAADPGSCDPGSDSETILPELPDIFQRQWLQHSLNRLL